MVTQLFVRGRRRRVHLVAVPPEQRAPVLPELRSRLLNDARTSYMNTLSAREQIPNQSRLTGNGYLARDPSRLNQQPAALPR
jgi:hypothetical protein